MPDPANPLVYKPSNTRGGWFASALIARFQPNATTPQLIAPCGIDCRRCRAYLRQKDPCPGCRPTDTGKPKTCLECRIKNCATVRSNASGFCYECEVFPCERLTHLDQRYRTRYGTDLIAGLLIIRDDGLDAFVEKENCSRACPDCGTLLCMHEPVCLSSGRPWR